MANEPIAAQLQSIAAAKDFPLQSGELVDSWSSAGAGIETVEPILRFMEDHPQIDFGVPGPLVHFVERFYGEEYKRKLIESISRRPTSHTVWMLNRVANAKLSAEQRQNIVKTMRKRWNIPARTRRRGKAFDGFLIDWIPSNRRCRSCPRILGLGTMR